LIQAGLPAGAYYLAGYAVESALKACIAKRTRRFEFPDRDAGKLYIHDLTKLVQLAGLEPLLAARRQASKAFEANWSTVKDWSEQSRYDDSTAAKKARDLYRAITGQPNGVMKWLRQHW